MNIARRTLTFMGGFLKSYGPSNINKLLWEKEFSGGKWNFIDDTVGDCVYPHLHRYLRGGSIMDLVCGPGHTVEIQSVRGDQIYIGVVKTQSGKDLDSSRWGR